MANSAKLPQTMLDQASIAIHHQLKWIICVWLGSACATEKIPQNMQYFGGTPLNHAAIWQ